MLGLGKGHTLGDLLGFLTDGLGSGRVRTHRKGQKKEWKGTREYSLRTRRRRVKAKMERKSRQINRRVERMR